MRKCFKRLGYYGMNEVKRQPWLKNFDWEALNNQTMPSPFVPPNEDNFDAKYTNSDWKDNNEE